MTSTMFGTPSYPSPLDRIRTGRRDRAQQLGLTPHLDISFDANQSFPKTCRPQLKNDSTPIIKTRKSLFKGTGLNDVSFSAGHSRGSFSNSPDRSANTSLGESWSFYNYVGGGLSGISFPTALRNPNKAIFTINAHTSEILMANEMACEMFEYEESELIGMRLEEMIQLKHKDQRSVTETHLEASGDIVEICGKVVDILDSYGQLLPVSLWVKPLGYEGDEPRCLVVMEPVERTVATVEFDTDGTILSCDDQLAHLHGYRHPGDVEGMKMNQLIPSFKCPTVGKRMSKDVRKQRATGRTRDGATFPLSIALKLVEEFTDGVQANVKRTPLRTRSQNQEGREGLKIREPQPCEKEVYVGVIWVFANIQGMITFLPDGTIYSINENFALMLFGYTQQELIGMHISDLIPDFIEVIQGGNDSISIPPSDEDSPQIGPHLNQSDPMVRCSLPNRKIEGEPRHSPISSNVSKQSKWGLGPASLFTGPGVTSTPSRSPATTAKGLTEHQNKISERDLNKNNQQGAESPVWNTMELLAAKIPTLDIVSSSSDTEFGSDSENFSFKQMFFISRWTTATRPEDFEVIWHKRHVPCEDDIVLEKLNQRTLSPKGGNRYFPPLQKEQPWYCKDFCHSSVLFRRESFVVDGQHRDGTSLGISFQLKRVDLEGGNFLYAMWLSRDPREPGEGGRSFANLTLASSLNSTMETGSFSLGEALVEKAQSASKVLGDDPIKQYHYNMTNDEDDADVNTSMEEGVVSLSEGRGLYNENYDTLRCIGKGAFGFVRLARRKDNYQEVVVKFIRRSKVLSEGWVIDEDLGKCPLEISLLSQLHHDNIVKVIDVYDNEDFYQMVMEKHGSGMDLFEFIDRNPNLDEALASYLFRQIVSAVFYLHSLGILHRDIKDENVILDEEFQVKLIDFGAAAYLRPGHYFKTFCGTLEYCSPEVLMGQSYRGPELEIWSLGVTLYTLIFRENPFYDVEETIECTLKPPFVVSNTLMLLLSCMLRKDLRCRATIQEVNKHNWVNQPVDISQYSWEDVLPNSEFYGNTAADHREDSSPAEVNNYTFEFSRDKFVYHGDPEAGRHETEDFDSESESEAEELETELQRCLNLSEMNECKVYVYDDDDDNDDDEYDVDDVEGAELSEVHHDRRLFGDC
ncbi:PAS domain-containing serine/threonine-protein kinase-like [Liolophura sinensis]|uniref:PAS domain-containing serine/threonine-protein kinase-like n=1 Tax=Liolophura sinensis TaxID=3198878 RepID=UPI0031595B40